MRHGIANKLAEVTDSKLKVAALIAGVGLGSAMLSFLFHMTVLLPDFSPTGRGVIEAALVGSLMAIFCWFGLATARSRRRRVLQEIRKVAELNHHVRNALQVIVYSEHLRPSPQDEAVLESVARIEKTLEELFPGVVEPARESKARAAHIA